METTAKPKKPRQPMCPDCMGKGGRPGAKVVDDLGLGVKDCRGRLRFRQPSRCSNCKGTGRMGA